jgi:hypothetical protein
VYAGALVMLKNWSKETIHLKFLLLLCRSLLRWN